jgi:hypothetical protein
MPRHLKFFSFIVFLILGTALSADAQTRRPFQGNWNWAEFATDKSELPPAYQDMELKEVPRFAVDLTIKQRGNQITGDFGIVARYLARVDEGSFSGTIKGSTVNFKVKSNFGGSATIQLTLRGNKLIWKRIKSTGQMYFPDQIELRRLKPGEQPPYVANDEP